MTGIASFVADAAVEAVTAAAAEMGPAGDGLARDAASLVHDPAALAARVAAAVAAIPDAPTLGNVAARGVALPAVAPTTANRRVQAANQAALVDLVRGVATAEMARRLATAEFRDRTAAEGAQAEIGDRIDERAASADTDVYAALRALRVDVAARFAHVTRALPSIVTAQPAAVLPSLVVSHDVYDGDIDRAGEIAAVNRLRRSGFVPARPIGVIL